MTRKPWPSMTEQAQRGRGINNWSWLKIFASGVFVGSWLFIAFLFWWPLIVYSFRYWSGP